jgi:hypothetical protein
MDTSLRKRRKSTLFQEAASVRSVHDTSAEPFPCYAPFDVVGSSRSHLVSSKHFLSSCDAHGRFGSAVVALSFLPVFSPNAAAARGARYSNLSSTKAGRAPVTIPIGARDFAGSRAKTSTCNVVTVFLENQPQACTSRRMKGRLDLR